MKLSELLQDIDHGNTNLPDIDVKGLSLDSRTIRPGEIFIAYEGHQADGHEHIDQARTKGAVVVLSEKPIPGCIQIPDLKKNLGRLAQRYFGEPAKALEVFAITGTNGKTSVALWLAHCFEQLQVASHVWTTIGHGPLTSLNKSTLTTPDAVTLAAEMAKARQAKAKYFVMEASSHALDQYRLHGMDIDVGIFTNLTQDHLDYHKDFDTYKRAKLKLFQDFELSCAIVNADDAFIRDVLKEHNAISLLRYGFNQADVKVSYFEPMVEGTKLRLETQLGHLETIWPLYGKHQLYNALAVASVLLYEALDLKTIDNLIKNLPTLPGRMQWLPVTNGPHVVVDYAHTPAALSATLTALRTHFQSGKIITVMGCGGERDRDKRPQMGQLAQELSDKVIITSDNPRKEDPKAIVKDIFSGMMPSSEVSVINDRASAIQEAIRQASSEDLILIAGKGHEQEQHINGLIKPFCDVSVAQNALKIYT